MNELERILSLSPEERTEADLEYLIEHDDDLTKEQKDQLEGETPLEVTETSEFSKDLGQDIRAEFAVTIKDKGEDGVLEAVVASDTLDRHGEILDIKGLSVKNYMKNPIVAFGHNYDEPPIAKTTKLTKTRDGKLIARMEFAKDVYDKAKTVYELYKGGFMKAFSIGFIPEEMNGNIYTKSEMIEFSAVLVPANPEALLLAKKKGIDIENLTLHNIRDMDIKALLAKIAKDGIDSLTLAEVKFLEDHKDDLTANQIKELSSVLKDEPKGDEPKGDEPKDEEGEATLSAIKDLTETVKTLSTELDEIKKNDPVKMKKINADDPKKTFNVNDKGEVTKEVKFLLFARGIKSGNFSDYLDVVGKDAMTTSDTGDVIPPAEFITEVQRLEESVGVAAQFANVRRSTSGAGLIYVQGDDDLEIFDTAEGGVKKSTKLSYKQLLLAWRKFAGILPITDELSDDSGVALWTDATQRFARAYAKREDQLVFTENAGGGNTKDGIIEVAGTNVVTPAGGNGVEDIEWQNLYDMIYGVPSQSAANGRFYLNRTILGVLAKLKDDQNRPLWQPSVAEGIPATLAGKPYTEVEVMPGVADDDTATAFVIFGDLRYATLGVRTDLVIKMFDTGTVGDPDEEDQDTNTLNLLTQDIQAMRAVKRMNAVVRFPEAFSVLKTAGIS